MSQPDVHLQQILKEISFADGRAKTDRYPSLRHVDAKVREAKLVLSSIGSQGKQLTDQIDADPDFQMQSRRVRLEALANYIRTALKFLNTGVLQQKRVLHKAPSLVKLTSAALPELEPILQERWLEAQKCQYGKAYFAAVIIMGSILEGLLLARCMSAQSQAHQATAAPKKKDGSNLGIQDWPLSALIDVAAELGWIKTDRQKFSHALRDSRNVVHPWHHARVRADFDEATCSLCWQVLNAAVDDLLASAP